MPTNQFDPVDLDPGAREGTGGPVPADYLLFALGAVRRRRRVTIGVLLACLSVITLYYFLQTPRYRAETRILAQRQQSLPSIIRSNVAEDRPTRAAWEIIHRRENLVELIKLAGLLESRPKEKPLERVRQATTSVMEALSAEDDPLEALILRLDRRLKVEAGEVTIDIELDWPDPKQAYLIVEGALQNFLEARHVQEVTALDETIAILLGRATVLRTELAKVTEETRRAVMQDATHPPGAAPWANTAPQPGSEDLVRLRSMLDAKERSIGDLEEFRRRRLAELHAQYESRRSVYAEGHPEMVNLRLDIAALTRDSPQIAALRVEQRRLREDYQARLAKEPAPRAAAHASTELAPRPIGEGSNAAVEQAEPVREARNRYKDVMESVNRAQLELDTARSAFKHRYKVIWPTQVPKKPISPNPWKVFGAGGLASLLLAFLTAAFLDWRSGRVLERWQVERGLGLPILWERSRR